MKEVVVFNGTQHKIEAVQFIHTLADRDVLLVGVQSGVFPITPLAYFAVDKTMLASFADSLGYDLIEKPITAGEEDDSNAE